MLFGDTYQTIGKPSDGIFRDRGSKFIAYAYPLHSENQIKNILHKIRLSQDTSIFRVNDDGEPPGSAGKPILNCLLSSDLTNILVVVVRYFGGTLLGIPGLIHAYKSATLEALASSTIIQKTVNDIYQLEFDYLKMNTVMRIIKNEGVLINKQTLEANCILELSIRKTQVNTIITQFEKISHIKVTYLYTL
jgi:putative IMPACT (imprinted ancient) family translation regulator